VRATAPETSNVKAQAGSAANADGQEFIRRLQHQEQAAFTRLVQSQQLALKRFIRSIAGNQFVDDILQETWLSAYRGLPKFEGRSGLKTWLFTIARNETYKQLTRRNVVSPVAALPPDEADGADHWLEQQFDHNGNWLDNPLAWDLDSPEALLQAENLRDCISSTVDAMTADQQTVLNLREIEQMSMQEISAVTGLNNANVRVLLHRARLQLLQTITCYQRTGECMTRVTRPRP
jgi:RNA polymerase sigma-70 factor (ECF subfamily)